LSGGAGPDQGAWARRGRPLRKLIHVATSAVPLAGWWLSPGLALAAAALLLGASLVVELARRRRPGVNRFLWRLLPSVFRQQEGRDVLGSTWLAVGALAALLLYRQDIGGTAFLFLAWGDPMAELVGRRWGRPGQRKSLAGSAGCLAACLAAALAGVWLGGLPPVAALSGAVAATLVERWSPPPDDNVWIPILAGAVVAAVTWLVGR